MNKVMIVAILFSLLLGCNNGQNHLSNNETLLTDTSSIKTDSVLSEKKISENSMSYVEPDTTVNNKLYLENYKTANIFYPQIENLEIVERVRSSPVIVFSNKTKNEYLLAYQYEGNTKNSFSCFEIGYLNASINKEFKNITITKEQNFITESGLVLGLTIDDVIKIKGTNKSEKINGSEITLSYRIDDQNAAFLKRYNMPGYFLEITFREKKVVKILYGFDYP